MLALSPFFKSGQKSLQLSKELPLGGGEESHSPKTKVNQSLS
jgi:hypothetical protein